MTGESRQVAAPRDPPAAHVPRGPVYWTCLVLGAAVMSYGLIVVWTDRADTHPVELAVWVAGAGVLHDFALAPLLVLLGWLSTRLPVPARFPVQLGLALSALFTVMFWPVVRGWGRSASVPSALPLDYARNLVIVLAIIWAGVGLAVVVRTTVRCTTKENR